MAAVERSIEVNVSVEDFFKVVGDYKAYTEFVKEMRKVEVGPHRGNKVDVTYTIEIDAGIATKQISYTLAHDENPPNGVTWKMVKGEYMKSNDGSWTLTALPGNRTKATYRIDVGFGLLVPKSISNFLTERNLPVMLEAFKARAEKLHGKR